MNPRVRIQFDHLRGVRAAGRPIEYWDLLNAFVAVGHDLRSELLAVLFVDGVVTAEMLKVGVEWVRKTGPEVITDIPDGMWSALLRVAGLSSTAVAA